MMTQAKYVEKEVSSVKEKKTEDEQPRDANICQIGRGGREERKGGRKEKAEKKHPREFEEKTRRGLHKGESGQQSEPSVAE